jgi:hypothetical protein
LFSEIKKEYRLRMSENWMLRKIFGPKNKAVTDWIKPPNEELHYRS